MIPLMIKPFQNLRILMFFLLLPTLIQCSSREAKDNTRVYLDPTLNPPVYSPEPGPPPSISPTLQPKNPAAPKNEIQIYSSANEKNKSEFELKGYVQIDSKDSLSLPYRAINYSIQLFEESNGQKKFIAEVRTNQDGEFSFRTFFGINYYLSIRNQRLKEISNWQGPFKSGQDLQIHLPDATNRP